MNILVNILVFGIIGALMMAALLGLLLVRTGGTANRGLPVAFGAMAVVVVLAVPALAASRTMATDPGAGLGWAFLVAFAVVTISYLANVALLPMVRRRMAAVHGAGRAARLAPSGAALAGGLLLCAALGLISAGIAVMLG